ncbi:MAG: transglutaminase-like domain-containing protein [Prevotella sp.]|nr:transglutaminase-like domain-containing protein [Prevotella sp.]
MTRFLALYLWLALCTMVNAQQADVRVLIDSTSVDVVDIGYYSYVHHQKFILNNSNGADHAHVIIGMTPDTELAKFEYQMTDLDGKVLRTIRKGELKRFEYSQELASDFYRLIAQVTPPSYPVVITRTEKIIRKGNVLSYPSFAPQRGYGMSVDKAVYQIAWPGDVKMRHKGMNIAAYPYSGQAGKKKVLRYSLSGLTPVTRVPFAPYLDEQVPYALFAPEQISYYGATGNMNQWSSLGRWQYGLANGRQDIPEPFMGRIRDMVADCHTEREKVARLYDYLGKNTRYVAIELGIGGYQPAAASSVSKLGFGDCKGLSNYMHALLKGVGIESRLVAIGTDDPVLYPDFANVSQLNHMVLAVLLGEKKDTVWLECTNPKFPLGYVHKGISGHDALLLSQEESRLVKLPEYADSSNLRRSDIRISLRQDASADVVIEESFHNHRYAEVLHLLTEKEQEQRNVISSWYRLPNTSFGTIRIDDVSKPFAEAQINTHLDGVCARYANPTGRRLFVPVNPLHRDFSPVIVADTLASNNLPMEIRYGYRNYDEIVIDIPEGWSVESLPAQMDVEEDFGAFHQKVVKEEGGLRISLTLDIHRGTYSSPARLQLLDMLKQVQKVYGARMVLVKTQ